MRRIYIHQFTAWPNFTWKQKELADALMKFHQLQGRLIGRMENLGFKLQSEAKLAILTTEVLKSSEIEGEVLNAEQVRSSIAKKLGLDIGGLIPVDRNVDGVVEMMLNATQKFNDALTDERLFGWHSLLFPSGRSGMNKIVVGAWRNNAKDDPMQVVSGAMGKEKVHFVAPDAKLLKKEMKNFLTWFNKEKNTDPVIKAAVAHLWFVTVHPFDDGNGRLARAIADMQLARADGTAQRFYSMSAQIRKQRNEYYNLLEKTQKGSLDITPWLQWFLNCLNKALAASNETLENVFRKAKFWEQHATTQLNTRQVLMLNKMLNGFDGKLNTSKWAKVAKVSADTALRDIQDLTTKNILVKEAAGGRSTNYLLADLRL